MTEVSMIGIDLAKHSFQMHGTTTDGPVAFRRKVKSGEGSGRGRVLPAVRGVALRVRRS